ncbi:hypothetical protein O181_053714 [Austropuccinia psidii MF-1]|uniref:Uncharacterized protein n=1 Tax=Austropuccinia psidii MF-1 TaxID=1389203 RepID=A0A9Q3HSX5_9BASI|nr:hypothetical protein [Austropuccinia psidii MF-1]
MLRLIIALAWSLSLRVLADRLPQSSSNDLLARSEGNVQLTDVLVMKDSALPNHGWLEVYYPNGVLAYRFQKAILSSFRGISITTLLDSSNHVKQSLHSDDDLCFRRSDYTTDTFSIKIDPRGVRSDKWFVYMNSPGGQGEEYSFERNYWNKDGEIRDEKGNVIAALTTQKSYDHWLNPGDDGVQTYTLHIAREAPHLPFVTLMGLVLIRVDDCGI